MSKPAYDRKTPGDYLIDLMIRAVLGPVQMLPYKYSLSVTGWFSTHILGPLGGLNRRIRENLAYVYPDMPAPEVKRICSEVCDSFGRVLIESQNITDYSEYAVQARLTGPGFEEITKAIKNGRPVIAVSGHFGNYQVFRSVMEAHGNNVAAIYRPLNNGYTNARYLQNLDAISGPNFSRGLKGTRSAMRHLKKGGTVALLIDQFAYEGHDLTFLGKPAPTMVSAAEFALRYNALLVPYFGIRQPNGVDFELRIEAPIAHSDADTMTQEFNDILGKTVAQYPGQWFWIHRRWKNQP